MSAEVEMSSAESNKKEEKEKKEEEKEGEEKKKLAKGDTLSLLAQCKNLILGSKINILLLAAPVAIFLPSGVIQFIASFAALMPLAAMLGSLTEDIALRTNDTTAALINVTFGNATEMILALVALKKSQLDLVKYSLVGSILGNGLLVLGSALVLGGMKKKLLKFNEVAVRTYGAAIFLSTFAYVVTTTLDYEEPATDSEQDKRDAILSVSRWCSLFLCVVYSAYIYFSQESHKHLFESTVSKEEELHREGEKEEEKEKQEKKQQEAVEKKKEEKETTTTTNNNNNNNSEEGEKEKKEGEGEGEGDEEDEEPQFSLVFAIISTAVVTVIVAILSDFLVESVHPAAVALHLSRAFIGIILIPIAGNVTEHGSALLVAMHGRIDLAVGIALGSAVQKVTRYKNSMKVDFPAESEDVKYFSVKNFVFWSLEFKIFYFPCIPKNFFQRFQENL